MSDTRTNKRQRAHAYGLLAEQRCRLWLSLHGYRVLEQRWRCPYGEIDLIARKGDTLCFIEVKARQSEEDALHALSRRQQLRIMQAASCYMAELSCGEVALAMRFDVMVVSGAFTITHLPHAFEAE